MTMKMTNRRLAVTAMAASVSLSLHAAHAPPADAAPASATFRVDQVGLQDRVLAGAMPVRELTVPVPASWRATRTTVHLVLSSARVRRGQLVRVAVNGTQRASVRLVNGVQRVSFTTPPLSGRTLRLAISGELARRCPRDGELRTAVTVLPSSSVSFTRAGVRPVPALADLPGALADRLGPHVSPLTVALPKRPSRTATRAAIVAASAVARETGTAGLPVRVARGEAQVASAPGPVLQIAERSGPARLGVVRQAGGQLRLTVTGRGGRLLDAARLLSSPRIAALRGRSDYVPRDAIAEITKAAKVRRIALAPAAVRGSGTLSLTRGFVLPVDQAIDQEAPLNLRVAYDAPGGGRVKAAMNGHSFGAFDARGEGNIAKTLRKQFARDTIHELDLRPGYNELSVTAEPAADENACVAGAVVPRLQLARGSKLELETSPRRQALQLALWPFPLYGKAAWSETTVALPAYAGPSALAALIEALANSARVTGVPADPEVTFRRPTASQRAGNLVVLADPERPNALLRLPRKERPVEGLLEAADLPNGGVALVAHGRRALRPLGQPYRTGLVNGRAAIVAARGDVRTVAPGVMLSMYERPRWPWIGPAAVLALFALGWLARRTLLARRRLQALPELAEVRGVS
jgi:hypothetical protein